MANCRVQVLYIELFAEKRCKFIELPIGLPEQKLFQGIRHRVRASHSLTYGLHVGSVEPNGIESLLLGGYDRSRCLTDPVVSSYDTVQLHRLAPNVSNGGHAYFNATSAYLSNRLRANRTAIDSVLVHSRPGAPHPNLPRHNCDAIALHLPVISQPDFNLYFQKTNEQAYTDNISSPHHISFALASDMIMKVVSTHLLLFST
jgi:hypothetical protein